MGLLLPDQSESAGTTLGANVCNGVVRLQRTMFQKFDTAGEPAALTPQRLRRVTNEAEEGSPAVSHAPQAYHRA